MPARHSSTRVATTAKPFVAAAAIMPVAAICVSCGLAATNDADHAEEFDRLLTNVQSMHEEDTLIVAREQWPRDVPLRINFGMKNRMFTTEDDFYRIELADCEQNEIWHYVMTPRHAIMWHDRRDSPTFMDQSFEVPAACVDDDGVVNMNVRIAKGLRDGPATEYHPFQFSVEFVDSADDILTPIADEAVTDHLSEHIQLRLYRRHGDGDLASLLFFFPTDLQSDLTISLKIELLVDDEVIGTARFVCDDWCRRLLGLAARGNTTRAPLPIAVDTPYSELLEHIGDAAPRARISSDPEYALRDFDNTKYWSGSFVVDVEVRQPGQ